MSGVPVWLLVLGGIPAAWYGVRLTLKGFRLVAHFVVTAEKAIQIILYELVPNEGYTLIDKADEAVRLGKENQRSLEMHLIDGHGLGETGKIERWSE